MFEPVTVHYSDEDPVTYHKPGDKILLETLKYWLGLTIREVTPMVCAMILAVDDPIVADGEEFEIGSGWMRVPGPRDKVVLREAMEETGRQIKTCQMLLEGEADRAEVVLINSIRWLEFWQVRAPTEEMREMFGKSLRRLLGGVTKEN